MAWLSTTDSASSPTCLKLKGTCSSITWPDSRRLKSRTSLINCRRCSDEVFILARHSSVFCLLFSLFSIILSIPIIPFIGVLISWLIFARNVVFALLAYSAVCKAFSSSACFRVISILAAWRRFDVLYMYISIKSRIVITIAIIKIIYIMCVSKKSLKVYSCSI